MSEPHSHLCLICGNTTEWFGFTDVKEREVGEWIVKCKRCELYSVDKRLGNGKTN